MKAVSYQYTSASSYLSKRHRDHLTTLALCIIGFMVGLTLMWGTV